MNNTTPTSGIQSVELKSLAKQLKKKVNGLLSVYGLLIVGTLIFFLLVVAAVIGIGYWMLSSGRVYYRALILLIGAIVVAGICVKTVLGPLFKIFERPKPKGEKITRAEYPELFAVIDDVVTKVECLDPKNVYISNECNAYVYNPGLLGYLFHGRQNLTIGLPLLMSLNKTEFKAILAHEFGHFTQKSVSINRTANLSEFICASIDRIKDQLENADADSYEEKAAWFGRLATKIMTKQYHKVAPLNGVLSRAQEFDADSYSYQIVGSEAAISSLSKISFFSDQWGQAIQYLQYLMHEEERTPQSVKMIVDTFVANANKKYDIGLTSDSHLSAPIVHNASKISWVNDDTHPSMEDRCAAIAKMPIVRTEWDDTPAFDYFGEETIIKIYNTILADFKGLFFANRTVFLKNDVTEDEVSSYVDSLTPGYLDNFYCSSLFFNSDTYIDADEEHPEYESFPFTFENACTLDRYDVAGNDLRLLQQIIDENSAKRSYYYDGVKYTGTNVPIQQHRDYYNPLAEKSTEIARHCNWWMSNKAKNDEKNGVVYSIMSASAAALNHTLDLEDAIRTVNAIVQSHDNSTKAKEYINNVDSHFRTAAEYMMKNVSDGRSRFTIISEWLDVKEEVVANVVQYFSSDTRESDNKLVEAYSQFHSIISRYRTDAWEQLKRVWIMPELIVNNK